MRPVVPPPIDEADLRVLFPAADDEQTMLHPGGIRGVSWNPPRRIGGQYDAVWRRHSRNVLRELEWLLPQAADHVGGRITRVGGPIRAWDEPRPPRIWIDRTVVRLAWYSAMDDRAMTLTTGRRTISLIVVDEIPPEHDHPRP